MRLLWLSKAYAPIAAWLFSLAVTSADTLLNFDTLPVGAPGNQLAASGVVFSAGFVVKNDSNSGHVLIPSPSNYLDLDHDSSGGVGIVDFVSPLDPSLPAVTSYVSLANAGLNNFDHLGWFNGMQISAVDINGAVVDSVTVLPTTKPDSRPISTVTLDGPGIHELRFSLIDSSNGGNALAPTDDWQFGPLIVVPEPSALALLCIAGFLATFRNRQASRLTQLARVWGLFAVLGLLTASPLARGQAADSQADFSEVKAKAEAGDADAQNKLGLAYLRGQGVATNAVQAVAWFRKAAEQGYGESQYHLGRRYVKGEGVPEDYAESVKWFRKAAEQNLSRATLSLGVAYMTGRGVQKDYQQGVALYQKAANQGLPTAQVNLGLCYANGRGVPQDFEQAIRWITKASEQGDERAKAVLPRVLQASRPPKAGSSNFNSVSGSAKLNSGSVNWSDFELAEATKPKATGNFDDLIPRKQQDLSGTPALPLLSVVALAGLAWVIMKRPKAKRPKVMLPPTPKAVKIKRPLAPRTILLCGCFLFVLSCLFPPWLYTRAGHTEASAGFSFLLTSPEPKRYSGSGIRLDLERLAIEWACVLVATGAMLVRTRKGESGKAGVETLGK